jgi:biopolymer transport protein ExbB
MWEVWEFLARGGPVMIPIALGSVTALAILFERLWVMRRAAVAPPRLLAGFKALVAKGDIDAALKLCQTSPTPMARILEAGLRYRDLPRSDIRGALEDVGRREMGKMSRPIEIIGVVGLISPLLGLLGTVTGMIKAFRVVAESSGGAVDPGALATGIWEALITTAGGLPVAIMAYLAYRYLIGRADRITGELETNALDALDLITGHRAASPTAAGPGPVEAAEAAEEPAR